MATGFPERAEMREKPQKALSAGLCILGAILAFTGMVLDRNAVFLGGIGLGALGYLRIRRRLRQERSRKEEEGE